MIVDQVGEQAVHIAATASIDAIPSLRVAVRALCRLDDPDDEALYLGACTEVLANAIDAQQRTDPRVAIEMVIDPTGQRVLVTDHGPGFDGAEDGEIVVDVQRGRGLTLARMGCPGLAIQSGTDGTTIELPVPHR